MHSPLRETATVQTSFNVKRWDAEQTEWMAAKYERWGSLPPATPDFAFRPRHFAAYQVAPYSETQDDNCNAVVQQGWVWLLGGVAGTTMSTKFSASNGRIGVGTSNAGNTWGTTYLVGDTGSGSTTSYYQLVSGAPVITTSSGPATLVFSASFGTGVGELAVAGVRDRQRAPRPGCTSTALLAGSRCSTGVFRTKVRRLPGKRGLLRKPYLSGIRILRGSSGR